MEQEVLTKTEYQYLENISKLEELTYKLEGKVSFLESENRKLTDSNEMLKEECAETLAECQEHVNDIEIQNDILEKQIEDQKKLSLTENEITFYYGCKADIIMSSAFNKGLSVLTFDILKESKFPDVLLNDKNFDGLITSNFKLTKVKGESNFTLIKI